MKIFVTGFHRAGSKTIAKHMAKENNIPWIEEHVIDLWDFRRVIALVNGFEDFVLQCPFLAHKVLDLVWYGKVYWADRNHIDIITSMKNGNFKEDALIVLKFFHDEFPNDPYWESFTADENIKNYFNLKEGEKFPQVNTNNLIKYYKLVVDVKKYFLKTKFKGTEIIRLENLPIYDSSKHLSGKMPLKGWELDVISERV